MKLLLILLIILSTFGIISSYSPTVVYPNIKGNPNPIQPNLNNIHQQNQKPHIHQQNPHNHLNNNNVNHQQKPHVHNAHHHHHHHLNHNHNQNPHNNHNPNVDKQNPHVHQVHHVHNNQQQQNNNNQQKPPHVHNNHIHNHHIHQQQNNNNNNQQKPQPHVHKPISIQPNIRFTPEQLNQIKIRQQIEILKYQLEKEKKENDLKILQNDKINESKDILTQEEQNVEKELYETKQRINKQATFFKNNDPNNLYLINTPICDRSPCNKDNQVCIENNHISYQCVNKQKGCNDCSSLSCEKCKLKENSVFIAADFEKECNDPSCCRYIPTCI